MLTRACERVKLKGKRKAPGIKTNDYEISRDGETLLL